jgi:hypothetical protein
MEWLNKMGVRTFNERGRQRGLKAVKRGKRKGKKKRGVGRRGKSDEVRYLEREGKTDDGRIFEILLVQLL